MYIDGSEFIWQNCTDDCISDRTKVIQVLILDQFVYAYKERVGGCCSVSDFCDFKAQYTVFLKGLPTKVRTSFLKLFWCF